MKFWTDFLGLLRELVLLSRESNSLQRELLQALGHPPRTQPTASSILPPPRPRQSRIYTDKDVMQVTRDHTTEQAAAEFRKENFPHVTSTEAVHPPMMAAGNPTFEDQPIPYSMPPQSTPASGPAPTAPATAAPPTAD